MCGAPSLFITHNLNLVLQSQASYKNFNGTICYSIGEGSCKPRVHILKVGEYTSTWN